MAEQKNIYREGAAPNTRLLNSLKVKLFAIDSGTDQLHQIGLVQTWTPSHSRTITANRGIGFGDQTAELSVGVTDLTASAEVLGMYLRNVMQVLGYKSDTSGFVRSLKHHKWPFDVKEEIFIPSFVATDAAHKSANGTIITWYEGCWMSSWGHSFSIGDVNVSQSAEMTVTDVVDPDGDYSNGGVDDIGTRAQTPSTQSRIFA